MLISITRKKIENKEDNSFSPSGLFHFSVQSDDQLCEFDLPETILLDSKIESTVKLEKIAVKDIESGEVESATESAYNYSFFKQFQGLIMQYGIADGLTSERRKNGYINLSIVSDDDAFSSLDWSNWLNQQFNIKSVQIRRIRKEKGRECLFDENINLLFLLSGAYEESSGTQYDKISNDFPIEVSKVTEILLNWNSTPKLKPRILTIAKFISKNSLRSIDFERYNSLHLMMHGQKSSLGLEDDQYHNILDWLPGDDLKLLDPVTGKYKFIMLSMCDGAKPEESGNSLAFNLIKSGVTEHVIGFNGTIGSNKTIPIFMEHFYSNVIKELNVEDAFNKAVLKLIELKNEYWLRPVLYKEAV